MKQRLSQLEERHEAAVRAAESERDLCLVISRLEDFAAKVSDGLDKLDRAGQRDIIRALVKRIEVGNDGIEIIFRVPPPNAPVRPTAPAKTRPAWQQCTAVRRTDLRLARTVSSPRKRLRSDNRQCRRMGPRRTHPHSHPTYRKSLMQNSIISSQTLRRNVNTKATRVETCATRAMRDQSGAFEPQRLIPPIRTCEG
jgi:site-specific DNA recombinase